MNLTPGQQVSIHPVGSQLVGRQVHPAPPQVLVDVTQEVGQLKGSAQCGGMRGGFLAGHDRAEDGQRLQADDLG